MMRPCLFLVVFSFTLFTPKFADVCMFFNMSEPTDIEDCLFSNLPVNVFAFLFVQKGKQLWSSSEMVQTWRPVTMSRWILFHICTSVSLSDNWTMFMCCLNRDRWKRNYLLTSLTLTRVIALRWKKGRKLARLSDCHVSVSDDCKVIWLGIPSDDKCLQGGGFLCSGFCVTSNRGFYWHWSCTLLVIHPWYFN